MNAPIEVSFSIDECTALKRNACQGRPYAHRVSTALALELLQRQRERRDYWPILDEIDRLEDLCSGSNTKAEEQFEHAPLHPLWHKHFSSARHMLRNIGNEWGLGKIQSPRLMTLIEEVATKSGHDPDLWQSLLPHRLVIEGYENRSARRALTGDWIVFAKHRGENYYLATAKHEAGAQENVQAFHAWLLRNCSWEFPFCF